MEITFEERPDGRKHITISFNNWQEFSGYKINEAAKMILALRDEEVAGCACDLRGRCPRHDA